ncbi:N-acetyltransferase [Maridesulfovibrio hydrothermalis]|uniref:Putative enzyme n=1 Tax=Maridesulfovibrio hydrothermalis AM13 = DSM 14728 TaxID=1121451 RepID=L0R8U2_9BACT|nr:N-acetyltransferase [Maridesulfovibrio hydrothermalis]CCO23183.1 putative enzyme [Maridesulfovibrio hydrothermalis AM13 = DSM 14728]
MAKIRKAMMKDAKDIHLIIKERTRDAMVLPRPLNSIYSHLRDFFVAESDDGKIIGCCALAISWDFLAEVRSLVVVPEARGARLGARMVQASIQEARDLGVREVFVLTNIESFFDKLGFAETDKNILPQKIWADCINCPQFPDCDEVPMIMKL